ncbi:MAG: hypothetical protein FJZ47_02385 [Candidatus Tectomicrobia bacterium]|uniref:Prepilin-type N-terminal cleavage/methylation domain-containing protein n=1 Tax=Tectimicrobiota bacterium TaxID=2528274 RepID=A0A937VZU9_UNCTE|nr:hypothetical protein [Candidatus Tectomicrobia bacterium]
MLSAHGQCSPLRLPWRRTLQGVRAEAGLSLPEVLTAVMVFSLGLAGLGGLQITALKLNTDSYIKTQMATIAQEQMEALLALPFTHADLQDSAAEIGQTTTRCVLYPPEGMRPCLEDGFESAHPVRRGRQYCRLTVQGPRSTACSDSNFPPPGVGYKVRWSVDVDEFGNPNPLAAKLAYLTITVSREVIGKEQHSQIKTHTVSFAKSSRSS